MNGVNNLLLEVLFSRSLDFNFIPFRNLVLLYSGMFSFSITSAQLSPFSKILPYT